MAPPGAGEEGRRGRRVSAAEIARTVGVSAATVSYVLNGRPGVSAEMRRTVLQTARELGYRLPEAEVPGPDDRTSVLGLVLTDISNPFYAEIAAGAVDAARDHGYEVFLAHTQESKETLHSVLDAMLARRVDGIVLTVLHVDDGEVVQQIRRAGVPFVQLSRRIRELRADFVGPDDAAAAEEVLRHVVEVHDHRDLAVITGPPSSSASATRAESFVATAARLGVPLPPHRRFNAYLTAEGGHRVVQRMLADDDVPRAVVCGSDAIASGVMAALRGQGRRVPEDVAVTGYDGVFPAASMLAELTTISLPRRRMSEVAVERLMRRIDGSGGAAKDYLQPHRLRIGTSCGCVPERLAGWASRPGPGPRREGRRR